jgi:hypothetical protein
MFFCSYYPLLPCRHMAYQNVFFYKFNAFDIKKCNNLWKLNQSYFENKRKWILLDFLKILVNFLNKTVTSNGENVKQNIDTKYSFVKWNFRTSLWNISYVRSEFSDYGIENTVLTEHVKIHGTGIQWKCFTYEAGIKPLNELECSNYFKIIIGLFLTVWPAASRKYIWTEFQKFPIGLSNIELD